MSEQLTYHAKMRSNFSLIVFHPLHTSAHFLFPSTLDRKGRAEGVCDLFGGVIIPTDPPGQRVIEQE
jgi:hypothetical protein